MISNGVTFLTKGAHTIFFAWSKLGAFGVILTMQLEPPKNRFVIEGHLAGWFVSISRVYVFDSHVHCFLLLLLPSPSLCLQVLQRRIH